MVTRLIAGPLTLYTGATPGAPRVYRLGAWPGGDGVGQLLYQLKVLDVKTNSIARVQLDIEHGLDQSESVVHSTPISLTTIAAAPALLSGQGGAAMLAPWLHPVIKVDRASGSADEWVIVAIYETRKAL